MADRHALLLAAHVTNDSLIRSIAGFREEHPSDTTSRVADVVQSY